MIPNAWVVAETLAWRDARASAKWWAEKGAQALAVCQFVEGDEALDPLVALGAYEGTAALGVCVDIDGGRGGPVAAREITALTYVASVTVLVITGANRSQVADHAKAAASLLSSEQVSLHLDSLTLHDAANRPQPRNAVSVIAWCGDEAWMVDPQGEQAVSLLTLANFEGELTPNSLLII